MPCLEQNESLKWLISAPGSIKIRAGFPLIPANVMSNPFSVVSKALGDSNIPEEWDWSIASFGDIGWVKGIGDSEGFGRSNAF